VSTFFVFSDCHGFFNELKNALDNAGFDPNNESHYVIGAGDYLDRGRMPQDVIDFLMELDRCMLVRGNHTDLLMDCLQRGFPYKHDWSNGTAQTICDLAPNAKTFGEACAVAYEKVKPFVDRMVNYVELKQHIIVHSFVPLKNLDGLPMYYTRNRKFAIDPDWRYAHASSWEEARWGNPFQLAAQGFLPEKTLVFGHWSTYDQRPRDYEGEDLFDPIYGDGYIGIDATTALSGKVNVLILEDEFIE
jgi:serine/threonine protein phosphatase 1